MQRTLPDSWKTWAPKGSGAAAAASGKKHGRTPTLDLIVGGAARGPQTPAEREQAEREREARRRAALARPVLAEELTAEQARRYEALDARVRELFHEGHAPTSLQREMLAFLRRMAEASGKRLRASEPGVATRGGCLLHVEAGLGKTLTVLWQAVCLLVESAMLGRCACGCGKRSPKVLVACPAALVPNWREECEKHIRPDVLRVAAYDTQRDTAEMRAAVPNSRVMHPDAWDAAAFDLCICSYNRALIDLAQAPFPVEALLEVTPTTRAGREGYAAFDPMGTGMVDASGMICRPFARRGLYSVDWCYLVCDEFHDLRNIESKQSRAVACLLPARRVVALTATAVHNSAKDVLPFLLAVRDPGVMAEEFASRLPDLGARVRLWTLTIETARRLKENPHLVEDDPKLAYLDQPLIETEWAEEFRDPREKAFHDAICRRMNAVIQHIDQIREAREEADSRDADGPSFALTVDELRRTDPDALNEIEMTGDTISAHSYAMVLLMRARQACISASLASRDLAADKDPESPVRFGSTKMRMLHEYLTTRAKPDERIIVYSSYVSALEMAASVVARAGRECAFFHGRLTKSQQQANKKRFKDPASRCTVLLAHLKVGGVGQTFTNATRVVYLEPWYNRQAERQAEKRAHRMGQTQAVVVTYLLVAGSIEEWVCDVAKRKLEVADAMFGTEVATRHGAGTVRFGRGSGGSGAGVTLEDLARGLRFLRNGKFQTRDTEQLALVRAMRQSHVKKLVRRVIPRKPATSSSSSSGEDGEPGAKRRRTSDPEEDDEEERGFLCSWVLQRMAGDAVVPRQCLLWSVHDPQDWSGASGQLAYHHWLHPLKRVVSARLLEMQMLVSEMQRHVLIAERIVAARGAGAAVDPEQAALASLGGRLASAVAPRLLPSRAAISPTLRSSVTDDECSGVTTPSDCALDARAPQALASARRALRSLVVVRVHPDQLLLEAYLRASGLVSAPPQQRDDPRGLASLLGDPETAAALASEDEPAFVARHAVPLRGRAFRGELPPCPDYVDVTMAGPLDSRLTSTAPGEHVASALCLAFLRRAETDAAEARLYYAPALGTVFSAHRLPDGTLLLLADGDDDGGGAAAASAGSGSAASELLRADAWLREEVRLEDRDRRVLCFGRTRAGRDLLAAFLDSRTDLRVAANPDEACPVRPAGDADGPASGTCPRSRSVWCACLWEPTLRQHTSWRLACYLRPGA